LAVPQFFKGGLYGEDALIVGRDPYHGLALLGEQGIKQQG
jgi:hypothetical protein